MPDLSFPIRLEGASLRPFEPGDFEQFCEYWMRPDVARYVPWTPDDPQKAAVGLGRRISSRVLDHDGDRLMLAIVDGGSGRVIGETMLYWETGEDRQGEIGYALHPDFQGRGLARTAAAAMLRLGFSSIGLHRIFGRVDPRNPRSAALLTALGLQQEAHLREVEFAKGEWCDQVIYAIRETDWAPVSA